MSNICKTVTLRTRKIKGGEQLSFYFLTSALCLCHSMAAIENQQVSSKCG